MSVSSGGSDRRFMLKLDAIRRDSSEAQSEASISEIQPAYQATLAAIEAQLKCLGGARSQSLNFRQNACNVLQHLLEQAVWLHLIGIPSDHRLQELTMQANEIFNAPDILEWETAGTNTSVSVVVEDDATSHISESDSLMVSQTLRKTSEHDFSRLASDDALIREFETQLSLLQETVVIVKRLKGPQDAHQSHSKVWNPAGLLRMGKRKELETSRQELRHRVNKCSQVSKALPISPQTSELLAKFGVMLSEAQAIYSQP